MVGKDTFSDYYHYYLMQHSTAGCRRMHILGVMLATVSLLMMVVTWDFKWLLLSIAFGYGISWMGHYFFEKNVPLSFERPMYSLLANFRMFYEVVVGKLAF